LDSTGSRYGPVEKGSCDHSSKPSRKTGNFLTS